MVAWYTVSQTLHIWSVRDGHYGSMVYCVTDVTHLVCERWQEGYGILCDGHCTFGL